MSNADLIVRLKMAERERDGWIDAERQARMMRDAAERDREALSAKFMEMQEFAVTMERERDEWQAKYEHAYEAYVELNNGEFAQACEDRDEALAQRDTLSEVARDLLYWEMVLDDAWRDGDPLDERGEAEDGRERALTALREALAGLEEGTDDE